MSRINMRSEQNWKSLNLYLSLKPKNGFSILSLGSRQETILLTLVLLTAFFLRAMLITYVVSYPERIIQSDARGYDQLARNIVAGNGFSKSSSEPFQPDNQRTPIYPSFIAFLYGLFDHRFDIVLYAQAIVGTLTLLFIYALARLTIHPKAGLPAAALLAISPHSITYSAILWSDTLFTFIFTASVLATVVMYKRLTLNWVVISGFLAGLATLTHPRVLYLPLVFAVLLAVILCVKKMKMGKFGLYVGLFLLVFNLVLVPWRIRNLVVFDVPNISSASGLNMLFYGAALTEASLTGEAHWEVVKTFENELVATGVHPRDEARYANAAFKLGLEKILEHPVTYMWVHTTGTLKSFLPGTLTFNYLITGQYNDYFSTPFSLLIVKSPDIHSLVEAVEDIPAMVWLYIVFSIIYLAAIYVGAGFGFLKLSQARPWAGLFLGVSLYLALVAGPAGTPRFHLPIIPLLIIVAMIPLFMRQLTASSKN
jgi:4-amino-4-deoxy-L-arabinose transferase-like glycosyltransferase